MPTPPSMPLLARIAFVLLVTWILVVLWSLCTAPAHAAPPPALSAQQARLATRMARVASHEGALHNLRDVDLVWQVTQTNGSTTQKQLEFLAAHSGRSIGLKPCTEDNCTWSAQLNRTGTIPANVAAGDEAYWRVVVMPRWQAVLQRARQLVAGAPYDRPCPIPPVTWGGVGRVAWGADDRAHAARDGLYPIGCLGTLNDGYAPRSAFK